MLRDRGIARRIADAVPVEPLVVEVGPGDGALTTELLDTGHRVVGVEVDRSMIERLKGRFRSRREFNLIAGDILNVDWKSLSGKEDELVVVGNLPYHLFSVILFKVFSFVRSGESPLIREMVIMVQREVGVRLTAEPGGRDYGGLTLLTKYHGRAEYLFTVPADRFHPKPKVDGAVVHLTFHQTGQFPPVDYNRFRRIVRGSFAHRRKTIRNALRSLNGLPDGWENLNYDFSLRPERFTFEDYIALTRDLFTNKHMVNR